MVCLNFFGCVGVYGHDVLIVWSRIVREPQRTTIVEIKNN